VPSRLFLDNHYSPAPLLLARAPSPTTFHLKPAPLAPLLQSPVSSPQPQRLAPKSCRQGALFSLRFAHFCTQNWVCFEFVFRSKNC
jgi:hypothetical protein